MTDTLRQAIVFAGAILSAVLARDAGFEPTIAAAVGTVLPALHATIDLAVHGPNLTGRQIGATSPNALERLANRTSSRVPGWDQPPSTRT